MRQDYREPQLAERWQAPASQQDPPAWEGGLEGAPGLQQAGGSVLGAPFPRQPHAAVSAPTNRNQNGRAPSALRLRSPSPVVPGCLLQNLYSRPQDPIKLLSPHFIFFIFFLPFFKILEQVSIYHRLVCLFFMAWNGVQAGVLQNVWNSASA